VHGVTIRTASLALAALLSATTGSTAWARSADIDAVREDVRGDDEDASGSELPYLQCVPYARQVSGIQIYGDAWTWWDQAEGLYAKGTRPKVGAVMSFRPYGNMRLGHVAAVSRVIDSRTVLLRHANWSLIDGRRGQIEDNVRAIDVSPNNDWSEVRVWFAPLQGLGTTHWPLNGFIYPEKIRPGQYKGPGTPGKAKTVVASAAPARVAPQPAARTAPAAVPVRTASAAPSRIGNDFLRGIRPEVPVRSAPATRTLAMASPAPRETPPPAKTKAKSSAPPRAAAPARSDDPIGRIIASRSR
jgi:surface antigen